MKLPDAKNIHAPSEQARYEHGKKVVDALNAGAAQAIFDSLSDTNPALVHHIVAWAFGDIYARPVLAPRDRQLVTLGVLTALGGAETQLKFHIQAALRAGLSKEDIAEVFLHAAVYAGIPRAMNASLVAKEVF